MHLQTALNFQRLALRQSILFLRQPFRVSRSKILAALRRVSRISRSEDHEFSLRQKEASFQVP